LFKRLVHLNVILVSGVGMGAVRHPQGLFAPGQGLQPAHHFCGCPEASSHPSLP